MRVSKPWGYELHWAKTERYVGKIIHVDAGHALSLQYHTVKDETILVWSGRIRFETGQGDARTTREMGPGESVHIAPGTVHRMTALEAADIFEVSTPELDDVVRLEDRYGRGVAGGAEPAARGSDRERRQSG
jgi:quercetin dioxygenase-like cupin family protein